MKRQMHLDGWMNRFNFLHPQQCGASLNLHLQANSFVLLLQAKPDPLIFTPFHFFRAHSPISPSKVHLHRRTAIVNYFCSLQYITAKEQ